MRCSASVRQIISSGRSLSPSLWYSELHLSLCRLNSVTCSGTETELVQCSHGLWGVTSCSSYWYWDYYYSYSNNLASVICTNDPINPDPVRLAGGPDHTQGRVEISYDEQWGTVCGNSWTIKDANVLCRSLGYYNAESAVSDSQFGAGNFSFILDSVNCLGDERFIQVCYYCCSYIPKHLSPGLPALPVVLHLLLLLLRGRSRCEV